MSLQNSFRGLVMIVLPSVLLAALLIFGQQIAPCDIDSGSKVSWLIYAIIMLLGAIMIYLGAARLLRLPELDSLLELIRKKK
jgi:hypothetical protein